MLYRGYIGIMIMEKNMETTGIIELYRGYIRILSLPKF